MEPISSARCGIGEPPDPLAAWVPVASDRTQMVERIFGDAPVVLRG